MWDVFPGPPLHLRSSIWSSFPASSCLPFSPSWIWGRKSTILEEKTAVDAFYCIWLRYRNSCLFFLVNSARRRYKLRHGKKIFLVNLWEEAGVFVRHLLINIMSTIICSVCEEDRDYRVDCILLLLFLQFLTPRLPTSREKREWRKTEREIKLTFLEQPSSLLADHQGEEDEDDADDQQHRDWWHQR